MNDVQSALATGLNQTKVDCFYSLCCVSVSYVYMKKMKRALTKDRRSKAVHTIINNNSFLLRNETGNLYQSIIIFIEYFNGCRIVIT